MFSPDGSNAYYEACREKVDEFPTDPNGGTSVSLGDNDFAEVILSNDANILFYGTRYDRFYIGSNGYITFGAGDSNSSASLVNHFNLPRISALFTDLDPTSGQVSYKQLDESVVVTFQDVPLSGNPMATNSFQIEMFFIDGSICVSWLELLATSGVAGLSKGRGLPPVFFVESNLATYSPCCLWGDFSRDYYVNLIDFATLAMHWLDEDCGIPYWCELTDLDFSSTVDTDDLGIFVDNWLAKYEWWLEPVGHWKFDKGDGDTAYDSAGFNHGTIQGTTWTTGKINNALSFDGVNDYVNCGNGANLNPLNTISIAAWIYPNALTTEHHQTIVMREGVAYQNYIFWIPTREGSGDNLEFIVGTGSSNSFHTAGGVISAGKWQHVVVTMDGGRVLLYVDAVEKLNESETNSFWQGIAPLVIGDRIRTGCSDPFNGIIDDVRIYDRALSAGEIWQLYQDGLN